jgi:hypothetical protein
VEEVAVVVVVVDVVDEVFEAEEDRSLVQEAIPRPKATDRQTNFPLEKSLFMFDVFE